MATKLILSQYSHYTQYEIIYVNPQTN